jgi:hypothetical protein
MPKSSHQDPESAKIFYPNEKKDDEGNSIPGGKFKKVEISKVKGKQIEGGLEDFREAMHAERPTVEKDIEAIKETAKKIDVVMQKAYSKGMETASSLIVWLSDKKEAAARYLSGEVETKFPTHNEIKEVSEKAHHAVKLAISTEIGKRAFAQAFEKGKFDLNELGDENDLPKKPAGERRFGLSKIERTIGEPQVFVDVPNGAEKDSKGNPKEIFVVVRTNNNRHSSKSTVMVATVKLGADGQPMWDGQEFDKRGVFSTMTETEYNNRCKGDGADAKWARGEMNNETYTRRAKGVVIENGQRVEVGLEAYWKQHDEGFTQPERNRITNNFKEMISNTNEDTAEIAKIRAEELAERTREYAEILDVEEERFGANLEKTLALMTMMMAREQSWVFSEDYQKGDYTEDMVVEACKKLGIRQSKKIKTLASSVVANAKKGAVRIKINRVIGLGTGTPEATWEMSKKIGKSKREMTTAEWEHGWKDIKDAFQTVTEDMRNNWQQGRDKIDKWKKGVAGFLDAES